ncbi:hypothetical protein E2C01_008541 [Portunus trituberculatus]|uniref:Uncharacterized protein n=1 Tax=Portunus trituberculatus TaxID=210409 RepID=A0A5B7D253_PORTR|nr:hypothetical protein [Portunus trituberculatus]
MKKQDQRRGSTVSYWQFRGPGVRMCGEGSFRCNNSVKLRHPHYYHHPLPPPPHQPTFIPESKSHSKQHHATTNTRRRGTSLTLPLLLRHRD